MEVESEIKLVKVTQNVGHVAHNAKYKQKLLFAYF